MSEVLTTQHYDIAGPEQPPALIHTEIGRPTDEILAVENMRLGEVLGPINPAVEQAIDVGESLATEPFEVAIGAMNRLPFIPTRTVTERMTHTTADVEMIEGAKFPINRIVGVAGFQSWAGRGLDGAGKVNDHDGASSAHHVYEYAQHEQLGEIGHFTPDITLFKDSEGQIWGVLESDGAHRTAAAKMRGDKELECHLRVTASEDMLPTVDFSIGEEILAQDRKSKTELGAAVLKAMTGELVSKSMAHEQARPPRPPLRLRTDESPVVLSDDFDREDFI